jgi:hypothetical protein
MVGDAIGTENRALTNQGLEGMLNPWDPDIVSVVLVFIVQF